MNSAKILREVLLLAGITALLFVVPVAFAQDAAPSSDPSPWMDKCDPPNSRPRPSRDNIIRQPDYPLAHRRAGHEAKILFFLIMDENGRLGEMVALNESKYPELDVAAANVVKSRWHWTPGRVNGKPTACAGFLELGFYSGNSWAADRPDLFFASMIMETKDFSPESLAAGESGTAVFRLQLDKSGKIAGGGLLRPSGFQNLDKASAALVAEHMAKTPPPNAKPGDFFVAIIWPKQETAIPSQ